MVKNRMKPVASEYRAVNPSSFDPITTKTCFPSTMNTPPAMHFPAVIP